MSNILLVEADAIVRNLMIRVLSGRGFTVYEAASSEEALALCESVLADNKIDLLVADHPTTGRDVAQRILELCANTKVLHVSGWPFEMVQRENVLLPGSSFLQKPFTASQLANAIQDLLNPRTH